MILGYVSRGFFNCSVVPGGCSFDECCYGDETILTSRSSSCFWSKNGMMGIQVGVVVEDMGIDVIPQQLGTRTGRYLALW
jgi:hypothetical protein